MSGMFRAICVLSPLVLLRDFLCTTFALHGLLTSAVWELDGGRKQTCDLMSV